MLRSVKVTLLSLAFKVLLHFHRDTSYFYQVCSCIRTPGSDPACLLTSSPCLVLLFPKISPNLSVCFRLCIPCPLCFSSVHHRRLLSGVLPASARSSSVSDPVQPGWALGGFPSDKAVLSSVQRCPWGTEQPFSLFVTKICPEPVQLPHGISVNITVCRCMATRFAESAGLTTSAKTICEDQPSGASFKEA